MALIDFKGLMFCSHESCSDMRAKISDHRMLVSFKANIGTSVDTDIQKKTPTSSADCDVVNFIICSLPAN